MTQDAIATPVLFRKDSDGVVTAIFPTEPFDQSGSRMSCYAHVGQHSGCDMGWYHTTTPATPEEYAPLKAELEAAPYKYTLKVGKRITSRHRDTLRRALR